MASDRLLPRTRRVVWDVLSRPAVSSAVPGSRVAGMVSVSETTGLSGASLVATLVLARSADTKPAVVGKRSFQGGCLCGINQVSGTFRPSRIIAQYAECFSIDWKVNGLLSR